MTLQFGNVKEIPGTITRGKFDLIKHPTGITERIAIIIASGLNPGPTLLLTGNIHGDEVIGIIVIHRLLDLIDLESLHGRIICIPTLNPTGHRAKTRYPQFDHSDPNRKWPDSNPHKKEVKDNTDWLDNYYIENDKSSPQEDAWKELYKEIERISPNFHVDLHTFSILSIPFIFLDRVLFEDDEEEATKLFKKTKSMVEAMGLTIVVESPAKRYVKNKLHRSTSGVTLNKLRIPSCTIELGPMDAVDPYCRDAAINSLLNLMKWGKMIRGNFEPITTVPVIKSKEHFRYLSYPRASETGIVDFQLNPGDFFGKGDVLVKIRNIEGEIVDEIKSELEGFIIGWWNKIAFYKGNTLGMVAVPDKLPMVVPWKMIDENGDKQNN
jgi:predicted deacylase